jgi:hypothetical protein
VHAVFQGNLDKSGKAAGVIRDASPDFAFLDRISLIE